MTRAPLFLDNAECAEQMRLFGELIDGLSRRVNRMVAHAEHEPCGIINRDLARQLAMLEDACADFNACADRLEVAHQQAELENAD